MVKEIVSLVDDLDEWNAFPWGEHMWQEFHDQNYMSVSNKRNDYMEEYARKGSAYQAVYNLWGFAFALKVSLTWISFSLLSLFILIFVALTWLSYS